MNKISLFAANLLTRLYGIWSVLTLAAVTIPTLVLLALIPAKSHRRRLVRNAARLWFGLSGVRIRVAGAEHLPARPCVVVANHASYLDGIILTAALPARFTFVIKKEMTRVPFANFLLTRIGSMFVERSDQHRAAADTRRILHLASLQQSLVFFPEGTFTAEPGLKPFRNGAFVAALRSDLPVVPVAITGSRRMLPAHTWLPAPARIAVTIRPGLETDAGRISTADLKQACRNSILENLDQAERPDPGPVAAVEE
jgi:1-acyl-sn-glycerol-3-phosphate acyltransferase